MRVSKILFIILLFSGTISAQFTGNGNGDAISPYEITNEAQLREINSYPAAHFKLMNNIDMISSTSLSFTTTFTGVLDGNGHSIINCKTGKGVFTRIDGGTVKNIWFKNITATPGGEGAGTLASYINKGTVKNCAFTGSVNATGNNMGGIFGLTGGSTGINITDCYVDLVVKGSQSIGSIVGAAIHPLNITRCFIRGRIESANQYVGAAAGLYRVPTTTPGYLSSIVTTDMEIKYTGTMTWAHFNRIIGYAQNGAASFVCQNNLASDSVKFVNVAGKVINSAADSQDGLTTADAYLKLQTTYENIGYVFGTNESAPWKIDTDSYPMLWFMTDYGIEEPEEPEEPEIQYTGIGDGTELSPYQITSIAELNQVNNFKNAHFRLMNDIDMFNVTGFVRIGNIISPFTGVFDGNGHKISNLVFSSGQWSGFFGTVNGGTIKNLYLKNISITVTGESGGGLVGYLMNGTIKNCAVTGSVVGGTNNNMGGIVGLIAGGSGASISDCYVNMEVSGNKSISSIAGAVTSPVTIQRCLTQGKLTSPDRAAAAVGVTTTASCSYTSIVAFNLDIEYPGTGAMTEFNRIIGAVTTPAVYTNNLAGESVQFINVTGKVIDSALDSKDGLTKTTADLKLQSTYENIGYVFGTNETDPWEINSYTGYPKLWFMPNENDFTTQQDNLSFAKNVKIYPNPATDMLHVSGDKIVSVEIFNLAGIRIGQYNPSSINISNLSKGLYYVKIIMPDSKEIVPFIKK